MILVSDETTMIESRSIFCKVFCVPIKVKIPTLPIGKDTYAKPL